jgi:hypothetical protein
MTHNRNTVIFVAIYNGDNTINATNAWRLQQERNQVCALQQISLFCNKQQNRLVIM